MFIDFAALMKPTQDKKWKPWAVNTVRITHRGAAGRSSSGFVRRDLRLTLQPGKMTGLREHLKHSRDQGLTLNDNGGLALRFSTPFGEPFIEHIQKRLQSIERLDNYIAVLRKRQCKYSHASLSRIAFTYNESPLLGAELKLDDGGLPVGLRFDPPDSNPHQRSREIIEKSLKMSNPNPLGSLIFVLEFTLPVLQTLDRLESISGSKQTFHVHVRSETWFVVKYRAPYPSYAVSIRAKPATEGVQRTVKWAIEFPPSAPPGAPQRYPEDLLKAMDELRASSGEHWRGMGSCIVADSRGVGTVLAKVDEIVRRFEGAGEVIPKTSEALAAVPQPQSNAPPSSANTAAPAKKRPDVITLD